MGTSGITHFHQSDIESPVICYVYKQSDGYPDGLGEQIKKHLGPAKLVNGIRFDEDSGGYLKGQVNGMGCAAAQFIAAMKDGVGGIYMIAKAPDWADYDYHIFHDGKIPDSFSPPGHLMMKIMSDQDVIWQGRVSEFDSSNLFEDEDA